MNRWLLTVSAFAAASAAIGAAVALAVYYKKKRDEDELMFEDEPEYYTPVESSEVVPEETADTGHPMEVACDVEHPLATEPADADTAAPAEEAANAIAGEEMPE